MKKPVSLIIICVLFIQHIAYAEVDSEVYQSLLNGKLIIKERIFIAEESPTVYLTFDDGPSYLTNEILDILKEEKIKATFFVLGKLVEENKEVVQRIVEEGHSIGNHSYSHEYEKIYRSFSTFWAEIIKTENIIFDVTGIQTSLVRTPGGTHMNWDSFYFYYMDQADYLVYDWNVDSGDSSRIGIPSEEIIEKIKKSKLNNKIILLMHDGIGHKETVKALPDIINYYRGKGYQFERLIETVAPITLAKTASRWQRNNEFNLRDNFIGEIKTVATDENIDDYSVKHSENLKSIDETSIVENEKKYELVDIRSLREDYIKLGEAVYKDNELWIGLSQLKDIIDIDYYLDPDTKIVNITYNNELYRFFQNKPFYLVKKGKTVLYKNLLVMESETYLPLESFFETIGKNVYWSDDLSFLIFDKKEQILNEMILTKKQSHNNSWKKFIEWLTFKILINFLPVLDAY